MTVEKTSAWTDAERTKHRPRVVEAVTARPYVAPPRGPWQGHSCPIDEHCSLCVDEAFDCGAAVLGGITGMGWAIWGREQEPIR